MKMVKLGKYISQIRGISFSPDEVINKQIDGFVPIIKSNNIKEDGFENEEMIYIKSEKVRPEQFIKKGDIVLTASSGSKKTIGKNIQFDSDYNGSFGAFCKLVRPKNEIYSKYLYHFFRTTYFRRSLENAVQGANISNLKNEYIDELKIPLLPLAEQIQIATVLSKAENLIAKRKQSIELLDEFVKSTFLQMFGDPVNKKFITKTIEEICQFKGGGTPSKAKPEYFSGNIPWVSPKDMKSLYITTSQDKITDKAIKESSTSLIPKGAVLMVVRSGILKSKLPVAINKVDVTINQDMKAFTSKEVMSAYLLYFFITNERNILKKVRVVTADNFNFEDIKKLKIQVPPFSLQNEFAEIVNKVEVLKEKYQKSLEELENLYGSLSQKFLNHDSEPGFTGLED